MTDLAPRPPLRTLTTCGCRCHRYGAGTHATCDSEHDTGSTGIPGVPSCSPHDLDPGKAPPPAAGPTQMGEMCPGPCNRDWHRLSPDEQRHPDQPLRPVLGEPVWCTPCTRRIERALLDLPDLYALLATDLAAPLTTPDDDAGQRRRRGVDAPSPAPRVDEQDVLARWLTQIEDTVRAERGFTERPRPDLDRHRPADLPPHPLTAAQPPSRRTAHRELLDARRAYLDAHALADAEHEPTTPGRIAAVTAEFTRALRAFAAADGQPDPEPRPDTDATLVRVNRAVQFLHGNLDWILASPAARERGAAIQRHRGRLRVMTATDDSTRHYSKPCPRCSHKTLRARAADKYIECHNCGRLMSTEEYDRLDGVA